MIALPICHSIVNVNSLAMVLGGIIRDLYCVRQPPFEKRLEIAQKHQDKLAAAGAQFSSFTNSDTSNARVLFSRQQLGIKLAYAHILIVLFRPFLLDTPESGVSFELRGKYEDKIVECLKAALGITGYIDKLCEGDPFFEAAWVSHILV